MGLSQADLAHLPANTRPLDRNTPFTFPATAAWIVSLNAVACWNWP